MCVSKSKSNEKFAYEAQHVESVYIKKSGESKGKKRSHLIQREKLLFTASRIASTSAMISSNLVLGLITTIRKYRFLFSSVDEI